MESFSRYYQMNDSTPEDDPSVKAHKAMREDAYLSGVMVLYSCNDCLRLIYQVQQKPVLDELTAHCLLTKPTFSKETSLVYPLKTFLFLLCSRLLEKLL